MITAVLKESFRRKIFFFFKNEIEKKKLNFNWNERIVISHTII